MRAAALVATATVVTAVATGRAACAHRAVLARHRAGGLPHGSPAPHWFGLLVSVVGIEADADRVWPLARAGVTLTALILVVVAPLLALGALVTLGAGTVAQPMVARRRRERAVESDLPVVVDTMVAALASGASLAQAVAAGASLDGPAGGELALVSARHRRGVALQASLDEWASDRAHSGASLLADALALAGTSGASQTRALEQVGGTLRERAALGREVRALGAQARLSAAVLVLVPFAFAAVVALVDDRIGRFLLATPLGWACIGGGLALDGAGAWWMHRLVDRLR
ncbi:N/A [soil metagenome]